MTSRTLWLVIILHIIIWTLVPTLVNRNLPLDVIEALAWGHEWQLGYDKHPPLSAWMLEIAAVVGLRTDIAIYLLSQLVIGFTLALTYKLAREWMDEKRSVIAVLLLETICFYNFTTPEFNVNVTQMPFWVGGAFAFWRAIQTQMLRWWVLLGVCSAAAILSKYLGGLMLAPLLLYACWHPQRKQIWTSAGPYVAAITCAVLVLPHLLWMMDTDFMTLRYGFKRASINEAPQQTADGGWIRHVLEPLRFASDQAALLVAAGIAYLFLRPQRPEQWTITSPETVGVHDARISRVYIMMLMLVPLAILALISIIMGARIRSMWTSPMLGMTGIFLCACFPPTLTPRHERQFLWVIAVVMFAIVCAFAGSNLLARWNPEDDRKSAFPGNQLADDLTGAWHERFDRPLKIVIGEEWLGGNIAWYSHDRPSLYHTASTQLSPWMSDARVHAEGALVLWRDDVAKPGTIRQSDLWLADLKSRFPKMEMLPSIELQWNLAKSSELRTIHVGFIPPQ